MFCKKFEEINMKSVDEAGGKGASLGEMTRSKIPVPPGYVVLASAFDRFCEETDLNVEIESALDGVSQDDVNTIEKASLKIRDMINDVAFPDDIATEVLNDFKTLGAEYVAVRSSATAEDSTAASWAGELESYLNIREAGLLEAVKKCWSSLFTPRAIFYRIEKNLQDQKVSVAVVVQKMVQSDISGIAFTVHPITEDYNQMVIEAGYGLGEAIVSGSVTPDTYVIDKTDFSLIDVNISQQERKIVKNEKQETKWVEVESELQEKQKLEGKKIVELAKACKGIEDHYKFPCDIEWAIEKDKIFITQSRPITTLNKT